MEKFPLGRKDTPTLIESESISSDSHLPLIKSMKLMKIEKLDDS